MSNNHQKLMDSAYLKWQNAKDWSYNQFLKSLTPNERKAVLLGNMNYQVENGGWSQWVYNGYCIGYGELVETLNEMKTENARKVIDMLTEIGKYLNEDVLDGTCISTGFSGTYFNTPEDEYHSEQCPQCFGSGYSEDEVSCSSCTGENEECEECGGEGYYEEETECYYCCGSGEVDELIEHEDPDLDHLSSAFYDFNEELMKEAEEFLTKLVEN